MRHAGVADSLVVTDTIALVVAVAAVLFSAWQSREVAKQTRLANDLAGVDTLSSSIGDLREVLGLLVERPELRQYFYGGRVAPVDGSDTCMRIETISDMLLDVLETAVYGASHVKASSRFLEDWYDYATHLLDNSPAMETMLATHPNWWPHLSEWRNKAGLRISSPPSND